MKAHVTPEENKRFKKMGYTTVERQVQYARAILKRRSNASLKYLSNALIWKFGSCIVGERTYKELKG